MIAIVVGNGMVWTSVIVSFSYLVVLHVAVGGLMVGCGVQWWYEKIIVARAKNI